MQTDREHLSTTEAVELQLPLNSEFWLLIRLTAAALASHAQFGVEEIDDLRLAADELCLSVTDDDTRGPMRVQFFVGSESIEIECSVNGDSAPGLPDREEALWSQRILDALVDEHGLEMQDGRRRAWLRKRRSRISS